MGRRYRADFLAMKAALDANRERGAAAMQEALARVAEAGRGAVAKPKPPARAPGRIKRLIGR